MSLGLLARDSIMDLEAFGRDNVDHHGGTAAASPRSSSSSLSEAAIMRNNKDSSSSSSFIGGTNMNRVSLSSSLEQQRKPNSTITNIAAANKEANPQQPPSFQYNAGFSDDYYYDADNYELYNTTSMHSSNNHHHQNYAPDFLAKLKNKNNEGGGFWCCVFPWLVQQQKHTTPQQLPQQQPSPEMMTQQEQPESRAGTAALDNNHNAKQQQQQPQQQQHAEQPQHEGDADESRDGESTNSNVLGERLSDKERQAVLARLRLAQPESSSTFATVVNQQQQQQQHTITSSGSGSNSEAFHSSSSGGGEPEESLKQQQQQQLAASERSGRHSNFSSSSSNNKGLLNGIPVYDASPLETKDQPFQLKGILKRRSAAKMDSPSASNGLLEPRLSGSGLQQGDVSAGGGGTTVSSGGSASVAAAVAASTASQAAARRRRSLFPSYEDRSKPRTTNSVSFAPMARVVTVKSKNEMVDEEKGDIWWQRSDYEDFRKTGRIITRAMLEGGSEIWLASNESSFKKKKEKNGSNNLLSNTSTVYGDKWWHRFGHSRRGLEHVVSIDEGRQRQMNVKNAIRAALEEQSRQKMYKREDPEKLRTVSLHHTSWARDLALASGASDADAVVSSFAEDRRSREFYLLKMSRNKPSNAVKTGVHVPEFMQPSAHTRAASAGVVPTSNMAQLRLDAHTASQIQFRRQKELVPLVDAAAAPIAITPQQQSDNDEESVEQVHDPAAEDKGKESLAQQAAGFSADGEKVNMAAVLSGMGAVRAQKGEPLPATMRVA